MLGQARRGGLAITAMWVAMHRKSSAVWSQAFPGVHASKHREDRYLSAWRKGLGWRKQTSQYSIFKRRPNRLQTSKYPQDYVENYEDRKHLQNKLEEGKHLVQEPDRQILLE